MDKWPFPSETDRVRRVLDDLFNCYMECRDPLSPPNQEIDMWRKRFLESQQGSIENTSDPNPAFSHFMTEPSENIYGAESPEAFLKELEKKYEDSQT